MKKPIYKSKLLDFYSVSVETELELPLYNSGVKAGFPSPAEDFAELSIDLNKQLIKNPASTFLTRVDGDSMKDIGIHNNDLLVVDRSLDPENGKIAVCFVDGDFTLKKIKIDKDCCYLMPANKRFEPIKITEDNEFIVWGIVTHVIKHF